MVGGGGSAHDEHSPQNIIGGWNCARLLRFDFFLMM
jgi:hypothetical protein